MITFERFRITSLINCLKKEYPEEVAHALAFIITAQRGEDISGFEPTNDGVHYVDYIRNFDHSSRDQCVNVNADPTFIENTARSTARKLWYKLAGDKVDFNRDEEDLIKILEKYK
ncbi:hypothetical protein GWK48_10980 [Metallosphaera tengchongensis]|uniref:Uncharacterized protein n=1 Tax=Metallosphaera tengchongensis TaxID=1532350 RepID=A0A6N0NVI9_9CREN|nr:hypothetical protein [Metallosphaera tengchongensis]QKR00836.1 hypothetical protein GWK48_10980 [Metallosphaera tengchongensis]